MKAINIISAVIIGLWLTPKFCMQQIGPDKIGVRKSIESGVAEEDFVTGWHLSLPLLHSWYELDATLHYMEFTGPTSLEVRTKENNIIFIDCVVVYRIRAGEAHKIVSEGLTGSYPDKVKSAAMGVLREKLASLSNQDVQETNKREEAVREALPALDAAIRQYHLEATHLTLRGIRFRDAYEQKLQNKQFYVVQGKLDEALQRQSKAAQETETLEKRIDKDIALKVEEWNSKIENLKSEFEVAIAKTQAEGVNYDRQTRADADSAFAKAQAEGDLAESLAQAQGEKLRAEALATQAGRTFSAIEAVRQFQIGDILLNSADPTFFYRFGSMEAWRKFFLPEGSGN